MKEKLKNMTLACIALLACLTFTACGGDDEEDPNDGIGTYYIQFAGLVTNIIDSNGNSLAETYQDNFLNAYSSVFDNEGKHTVGRCDAETARDYFDTFVETIQQNLDSEKSSVIENGYIEYYFVLYGDAKYNGAYETAAIRVTNTGATLQ